MRALRRKRRDGVIKGSARVGVRTKDLILRLRPGDVAVIDHEDLDRVSAEGLVERGTAAVVNASRSVSGRYPNDGPLVLARAGIPLVDAVGPEVLERLRDGDEVRIEGGSVFRGADLVASGLLLDAPALERMFAAAQGTVGEELEKFVGNTLEYLRREGDLILQGVGVPEVDTRLAGRHALVVVRGYDYRQDLAVLRGYIAEMRPVIVAVDGAADALLEEGLRPHLIVGDMDSVSTTALTCGAELVVHAYPDGRAPGIERIEGLGLNAKVFRSGGTSEDIALLLAYERGAEQIVAVGTHFNLVEFLDKGRGGMASTFLVRLKVGTKLVDAKGVSRLYRSQVRTRDLVLLVLAALAAMLVITWMSEPMRLFAHSLVRRLKDVWFDVKRVLP